MVSFEEFQSYIMDNILDGWLEDAEVRIQDTRKNNGVTYRGLYVREPGNQTAPSICLEDFYYAYQNGESLEEIIRSIRAEYCWAMERAEDYQTDIAHFEDVKDRIIFRLINYTKNEELSDYCPVIRLYDLLLTFRWIAHTDDIGLSTALITNKELEIWGISVPELLLAAQKNTCRIFPPCIINMDTLLEQMGGTLPELNTGIDMYIMTNTQQINGATVLVYDNVVQEFAEELQDDLYLLPSSIHEIILVPASQIEKKEALFVMVREANRTIVSPGDVLSDGVYYFDRGKKRIAPVKKILEE